MSCDISTPSQQRAAHIQTTFFSNIVLSATEMINHLSMNYKNDVSFFAQRMSPCDFWLYGGVHHSSVLLSCTELASMISGKSTLALKGATLNCIKLGRKTRRLIFHRQNIFGRKQLIDISLSALSVGPVTLQL